MKLQTWLVALTVLGTANLAQAVPQQMIYEGYLTDLGDRPINESLSIQVGLFADADSAQPIWREDYESVDVEQGYFVLRLGSEVDLPMQAFNGGDLYLGMSIGGAEILPRRLFASVAFALRAGQADDVAGRNISPRTVIVGGDVVIDENGRWVGDPTGLQGQAGADGVAGADGERGPIGDRGPAGIQGDRGPQGVQGERGLTGERGGVGATGDRGPVGPQGAVGPAGPRGDRGPIGAQGATGERGPIGVTGAAGDRGIQGIQGIQGVAGPIGATGPQGAAGPQGDTGATGSQGATGATGATGAAGAIGPRGAAGTSFVHWGAATCPNGAEVVYAGVAAGAHYTHGGSGANTLCLPNNPQHRDFHDGNQNGALLYGVEYENAGMSHLNNRHDRDAVCAVCWVPDRSHTLMIPGRYDCLAGWSEAYDGQLMATSHNQAKSEFVCVTRNPTIAGSATNHNGHLWYPTEIECGSLNCGATGYRQDREVSCVVCTR